MGNYAIYTHTHTLTNALTKVPEPQFFRNSDHIQTEYKQHTNHSRVDNSHYTTNQTSKAIVEKQDKGKPVIDTPTTKQNKEGFRWEYHANVPQRSQSSCLKALQ
jgi:hypothetical protein